MHHKDFLLDRAPANSQVEGDVKPYLCSSVLILKVCVRDGVQFPGPRPCSSAQCLQVSPVPFKLKLIIVLHFHPNQTFPTAETDYYWNLSQIELSG